MRTKLISLLSLSAGSLLLVGAGCMTPAATNTNVNAVVNTVVEDEVDETADVEEDVEETTGTDEEVTSDEEASISIESPEDGATVASSFDVVVNINDFELAPDSLEGANVAGEGHYHVWLDGEYFAPGVAESTTLEEVAVGEHELQVSLQNNDHSDLSTPVMSEVVTITVE